MLDAACMMIVDLPIPGSPEIRTSDPLTSPPPSTLFSSPIPVLILWYSLVPTSFNFVGFAPSVVRLLESSFAGSIAFSSTKEFHAPQMHCPIHVKLSYPHSWHTNTVLAFFAIISPCTFLAGHHCRTFVLFYHAISLIATILRNKKTARFYMPRC